MLGRVTRRASRIGMQRVKLVFSIVITELIVPKNTKIKQNTTLSICFEKGGKVSSTRSFNFDLNKNTVNPLNVNMPCVAIPINEKVELVATLYKDPSTGKYQAKEGKILLRKLKKNAIAGIDAFKGIGIHALQLHELATELGFETSLTKEVELPFSRLDHSSIKATITTKFLRELNADEVDETMSQFSMMSDASDMSTLGATFRYDDLEGVSKKAGMGDERFMGTTSTDSTPRDGKEVSGFYPIPLGSVTSGNAILSTPLKRKSGSGFVTPRTGGDSTGGRTPSPGMGHVDSNDQNEEYPLHKRHGSGHRLMELHKAQEDAARSDGTPPLSPRTSEVRGSDAKRRSISIIAEAEVESEVESEIGTPASRLRRRLSSDEKVVTAPDGIAYTESKVFPTVPTKEEGNQAESFHQSTNNPNAGNPPHIVEAAVCHIDKASNSSVTDDSSEANNTRSDEPTVDDVGKFREALPPKAEVTQPVANISDNERASTDSKADSDEGEVLVPSITLPPQASSPKQQQETEVISLSRKELVTRANREAFELYQRELNARAERIKQLEEQLKLQATGYKAEIMTLKTELNTVHADLHMRVMGGGTSSNGGSYAAWRDRSVSAAARKNVWGSAVIHDSESDEDRAAGCSDMGSDDGIAAAALAAVRDSEDFDAGLANRREGIAEKFEPEDEDNTKSDNAGGASGGLPPIAAGRRGSNTELLQKRYANFSRRTSAASLLSPVNKKGNIADTEEEIKIKHGLEEARESSIYFNNDHIAALRAVAAAAMKEKVSKEEKVAAAAAAAVEVAASTLSAAAADGDNAMMVLIDAASTAGTNESLATGILNASMMDTANDTNISDPNSASSYEEVPSSPTKSESGKSRNNVSFAAAIVSDDSGRYPSEHSKQSLTRSMVMRNPAAEEAVADLVAEYGRTTAELEMMAHDLYFYKELAEKAMEEKAEETMAAREAATAAVEANMRRAVVEEEYKDMSEKVVQLMMEQGRMQVKMKEERRKNQALKNRMLQYAEKMGALELRYSNVDISDVLAATAPSPMPNSPVASHTSSTNRKW